MAWSNSTPYVLVKYIISEDGLLGTDCLLQLLWLEMIEYEEELLLLKEKLVRDIRYFVQVYYFIPNTESKYRMSR